MEEVDLERWTARWTAGSAERHALELLREGDVLREGMEELESARLIAERHASDLLREEEMLKKGKKKSKKRNKKNKAKLKAAARLSVDYDNLLRENMKLRTEVDLLKDKIRKLELEPLKPLDVEAVVCMQEEFRSNHIVGYDPLIVFEFKPVLCPRFPEKRETLSLDAGFAQTPVLDKILRYYDFKASSLHIHREIMYTLDQDPSTTSFNNKDLGIVSSKIAPSVVAVSSFFGLERKFDCSGLVIHWSPSEKEATILTSAKLLYNPKDSEFEFHLVVRMADGSLLLAREERVDYYYNLLTLKVKPLVEPEVIELRSRHADVIDGMKVISLSRSFFSSALYDSIGKLYEYPPNFGCCELVTSDCGIREIGEGGPLVTDAGYLVGISFFGHYQCAHPLPTAIVISCLEMWKSSSTVHRPWFGIKVIDVNQACKLLSIPGKKVTVSNHDLFVFVQEVYEGSVASKNNIRSGASVSTLNGTRVKSVKQYSRLLSEASRAATAGDCNSDHHFMAVINPFDRPADDITIEADYISVDDKKFSDCWPQVEVEEWFIHKIGLRNPGFHWPPLPEEDDKCSSIHGFGLY